MNKLFTKLIQRYYKIIVQSEIKNILVKRSCPLCGENKFQTIHESDRYDLKINTVKCLECELVQINPLPKSSYIDKFYSTNRYRGLYIGSLWAKTNQYDKAQMKAKANFNFFKKYIIGSGTKITNDYKILDFGSAVGGFLSEVKQEYPQIKIYGVEPGTHISQVTKNNLDGIFDDLAKIPGDLKFDCITSWHVIEHVWDPTQTLKKLKSHLKENGKLIIEIPELQRYEGIKNFHLAHLFHFDQKTMSKILEKSGFKLKYLGHEFLQDQKFGMKVIAE